MGWKNAITSLFPSRKRKSGYADVPPPESAFGRGYGGTVGVQHQPLLPGARTNYHREAGDLWRNTVVAACLGWKQDNIGQARLHVVEPGMCKAPDIELPDDPAALLLAKPNPFMTLDELLGLMILSDDTDGNTYLLKARGGGGYGEPQELWWVPPWMITPWADSDSAPFIDSYRYQPGTGGVYYLPLSQVIHIKNGVDPRNTRLGCARLKHALRSIVGLNRGETYTAAIIANGGPIRLFIPDGGGVAPKEAQGIKTSIERATQSEHSASIQVASVPGHFEAIGSGPEELSLNMILDRPEANVHAILGLNAMVTGMAVGNNTRTFTNLKEAESQAWTNGLIPKQKRFAKALTEGLLRPTADGQVADFPGSPTRQFQWDWSKVQALSEEESEKINRAVAATGGPVATINEGRAMVGLPRVEGGDNTLIKHAEDPASHNSDDNEFFEEADDEAATDESNDYFLSETKSLISAANGKKNDYGDQNGHWVTVRSRSGKPLHIFIKDKNRSLTPLSAGKQAKRDGATQSSAPKLDSNVIAGQDNTPGEVSNHASSDTFSQNMRASAQASGDWFRQTRREQGAGNGLQNNRARHTNGAIGRRTRKTPIRLASAGPKPLPHASSEPTNADELKRSFDEPVFWEAVTLLDPQVFEYWRDVRTQRFGEFDDGGITQDDAWWTWLNSTWGVSGNGERGHRVYVDRSLNEFDAARAFINEIRNGHFAADFNSHAIAQGDPDAMAYYAKWWQQQAGNAAATGAEAYLAFIGLFNEGTDFVQNAHDLVANGNPYAALGLLPVVSAGMVKFLDSKTGRSVAELTTQKASDLLRRNRLIRNSMDSLMEAAGNLKGRILPDHVIDGLRKKLKDQGAYLDNDPGAQRHLDNLQKQAKNGGPVRGSFTPAVRSDLSPVISLRKGATMYDFLHEYAHFLHYKETGREAYLELSKKAVKLELEQKAYDTLRSSKAWSRGLFSKEEKDAAKIYIRRSGGIAW